MTALDKNSFLEWQYNALRKEIETSKDRHFKITAGTLILVPAVELLAIAVKEMVVEETGITAILVIPMALMLLLLPVIVLILYVLYLSEHYSITRCGRYIREYIEPEVKEILGWEAWLGPTWLEYKAVTKAGSSMKMERRVHEDLQMVAFRILYLSLAIIAAVSAVFVCFHVAGLLTEFVGVRIAVAVGVLLIYMIVVLYVWRRVDRALRQVGEKIIAEESSSAARLVGTIEP